MAVIKNVTLKELRKIISRREAAARFEERDGKTVMLLKKVNLDYSNTKFSQNPKKVYIDDIIYVVDISGCSIYCDDDEVAPDMFGTWLTVLCGSEGITFVNGEDWNGVDVWVEFEPFYAPEYYNNRYGKMALEKANKMLKKIGLYLPKKFKDE